MRVRATRYVLAAGLERYRSGRFCNQVPSARPNDVHSQEPICFAIRQNFHFSIHLRKRLRSPIGSKRKRPFVEFNSSFAQFGFRLAVRRQPRDASDTA